MNIDRTQSMLKMTCRCPFLVSTSTWNYFLHEIVDDGTWEFAMISICNTPVNAIDLYIEKVDLNFDVYPIVQNLRLSGPCRSPPSAQCTPLSIDPLQQHEFSGPINEGCPLNFIGSSSRPSKSHSFGGTSKKGYKSRRPIAESMVGAEGGIDYVSDAEYRTGEDLD
ncbi:hypothetical protein LguiB_013860 [Lonicera macranthoides]